MPRGRPKGSGVKKEKKDSAIVESGSREYIEGYRGKESIKEGMEEYDVLCIVREAMRAEHERFDWLKFLNAYRNTANYSEKTRLIKKFAPSVTCI